MSNEERLKSILSNLGKATLRGVRKCPKCGTYNGSRGLSCKNKYCNAVFKEPGEKRKLSTEACKLITDSFAQVFSVKVRDRGPDYRGFVQLPLINATTSSEINNFITQTSALCFIDNCERSFDTSVLGSHQKESLEETATKCLHIQAALRCYAEAQPLTLKNSILLSLNVNNEIKQEIWLLATETPGPLVQRVSKHIMVVKCKATPKHPLGYLHFSFFSTRLKDRVEHRFSCSCTTFRASKSIDKMNSSNSNQNKRCIHFYACICAFASEQKLSEEFKHYVVLVQAEFSIPRPLNMNYKNNETDKVVNFDNDSLEDEARFFILRDDTLTVQNLRNNIDPVNLNTELIENNIVENMKLQCHPNLFEDSSIISQVHDLGVIDENDAFEGNTVKIIDNQIILDKLNQSIDNSQCVDGTDINQFIDGTNSSSNQFIQDDNLKIINENAVKIIDGNVFIDTGCIQLSNENTIAKTNSMRIIDKNAVVRLQPGSRTYITPLSHSNKRKREEKLSMSNPVNIQNLNSIEPRKIKSKLMNIKKISSPNELIDESTASQSFIKWLASVTERINQTMHFQFNGKPDPLVFHTPQIFFECLRERISWGSKKKRLPNSTTAFVRRDGVPLGTFTKYTWQITNILQVKSIFETPLIPLEITRSFIQNADGSYDLYKREETAIDQYKKTMNTALIKPLELKTFLKVGNTSPSQKEPTPFLIEWIPDILPISKIGELRIRFEFGHVKNE